MSNFYIKQVAEITNKSKTMSANEKLDIQMCASVLDFINDVGSIEQLKEKIDNFLKAKK